MSVNSIGPRSAAGSSPSERKAVLDLVRAELTKAGKSDAFEPTRSRRAESAMLYMVSDPWDPWGSDPWGYLDGASRPPRPEAVYMMEDPWGEAFVKGADWDPWGEPVYLYMIASPE